ncbi:glycosyltransferase [Pseudotabrizicola algicola]|uniref:Glycosyltransferase n=1 Tax=Pseudotabrizicola algicola TaxID=2709381 RepID=A0A6B3RI93_9RHOB|nr:glycosyltransferase [Pseudotabrizicola algicola]NEX44813.1 glycosyltransferase [Pseudotabrizicola algicola]
MMRPLPCAGFFDPAYYQSQLSAPVPDALAHFRAEGDRLGLDPSPYFSTRFYKQQHPDWATRGKPTALDDYLAQDVGPVWLRPHPMIDPDFYLQRYPDVAASGMSPGGHFARHGDAEGRSPSGEFDAVFYRRCYLRLEETGAFAHFMGGGKAAGHLPKPAPRSAVQSAKAMADTALALNNPILLAAHDAQEAGVPLLLLDLARDLAKRGFSPIFVLQDGGPLVTPLRRIGTVFVLAEGWHAAGLCSGVPAGVPVIVSSAVAAPMAEASARAGLRTLLLVHEMRGYLEAQGLIPALVDAQRAGARLIASFPRMAEALEQDLGPLPVVRPGVVLPVTPLDEFRLRRRSRLGRHMFIGAGHADRRKGFDLFLAAAHEIATQLPQARFVWLGALDPWARQLAGQAQASGLPLTLPGFVAQPLGWYGAASVYLLTSREDAGPTTLIHAAATGTPFVGYAADIGLQGIADPLGRFVASGDQPGFVAAALDFARSDTPRARHNRRALLRPHLGLARYCDELLSALA